MFKQDDLCSSRLLLTSLEACAACSGKAQPCLNVTSFYKHRNSDPIRNHWNRHSGVQCVVSLGPRNTSQALLLQEATLSLQRVWHKTAPSYRSHSRNRVLPPTLQLAACAAYQVAPSTFRRTCRVHKIHPHTTFRHGSHPHNPLHTGTLQPVGVQSHTCACRNLNAWT